MLDVCIKCNDLSAAERLMKHICLQECGSEDMGFASIDPDLITFSTLIKGYCHNGDLNTALDVAGQITRRGLKCDELVYNTLLDGCVKAKDLTTGVGLFAEMVRSGMLPSAITHSILIRLYKRAGYEGTAVDA